MSEKKESGKSPRTRPSLKVSIPIEIFLKWQERMHQANLLQKQREMLDKMKEDHKKKEAVAKPENNDKPKVGNFNDKGEKPAPEVPPKPRILLPCGRCQPRPPRPKRPQRPKQPRRNPHGHAPRPQGPQRPNCDINNNIPMRAGGNQLAASVNRNIS